MPCVKSGAICRDEKGQWRPFSNGWPNNILDDGRRAWLLDWEFAGRSAPLYALATLRLAGGGVAVVVSAHVAERRLRLDDRFDFGGHATAMRELVDHRLSEPGAWRR